MQEVNRTFEYNKAVRKRVPLLLGLVSPSGGGKTYSALRLATGIKRVTGGDIAVIDTESNRALHYAKQFDFHHIPFGPPFSPMDYLACIEHCVEKGASTLIIDSLSHEHESIGGVLEWHQKEVERLSRGDSKKASRVQMLAWSAPKQARRQLINRVLQLPINLICCFRAKQKLKLIPGKDPEELGWMAIGGEEWIYEFTASMLLYPKSGGVPTWASELPGERATMKQPRQFASLLEHSRPLDEDIGQAMADWAAGDDGEVSKKCVELLTAYCDSQLTHDRFVELEADRNAIWARLTRTDKATLKSASDKASERLKSVA